MVSGCVGFVGVFALTVGPSRSLKARFVRKVSRIFQVVSLPCGCDDHARDCHRRGCCLPWTARTTMSLSVTRKYTATETD